MAGEAVKAFAEEAFEIAANLAEENEDLKERRRANRELLRNLDAQGSLTPTQETRLDEIYPRPNRGGNGAGE